MMMRKWKCEKCDKQVNRSTMGPMCECGSKHIVPTEWEEVPK
jgi:DNA-directed RNA polymerase subunit RPC12/RpoP